MHDRLAKSRNLPSSKAEFWHIIDTPLLAELESLITSNYDPTQHHTVSGETLFGMAASVASYRKPGYQQKYARYILYAAQKSFPAAEGIANRIIDVHGPFGYQEPISRLHWLKDAVRTGSLIAGEDLASSDAARFQEAKSNFRRSGGYNNVSRDTQIQLGSTDENFHALTIESASQLCESLGTADQILDNHGNRLLHYAATFGSYPVIKYLVEARGALVDVQNYQGETPLYEASLTGDGITVKTLIQLGAKANVVPHLSKISCLHWLFNFDPDEIGEVARMLIVDGKADVNAKIDTTKLIEVKKVLESRHFPFHWPFGTPLHWAVAARSRAAACTLLENGADIDAFDFPEAETNALTALSLVVYRHDADMVEFLIDKGADCKIIDGKGRNLIHLLVANDSTLAFRLPRSIWSWVTHGSQDSHIREFKRCLLAIQSTGAQLDQRRNESQTPLVDAVEREDACATLLLLELGADPDILCRTGETLLQRWLEVDGRRLAYPALYTPVLSKLLKCTKNLEHHDELYKESIYHFAVTADCSHEQFEESMSLLSTHAPASCMNAQDKYGVTPFLKVLSNKDTKNLGIRAQRLIQHGVNIAIKNDDGEGFLHYLCDNHKVSDKETVDIISGILAQWEPSRQKQVASESRSKRDGATPLMKAVRTGKLACVELLSRLNVDVDVVSKNGRTALDFSMEVADGFRTDFIDRVIDSLARADRSDAIEDGTAFDRIVSYGSYPSELSALGQSACDS